jgi:hypothetical protein
MWLHVATVCLVLGTDLSEPLSPPAVNAGNRRIERLIEGALARRDAIVRGQYRYVLETGFQSPARVLSRIEYLLTVDGGSWRLNDLESGSVTLCHAGKLLRLKVGHGDGGRVVQSVGIEIPRPLNGASFPYHATVAGTIWYDATAKYVRERVDTAVIVGQIELDGNRCDIIDFQIGESDTFRAFEGITSQLRGGGVLRLHIAEQLGYVLPRIEYVAPDGSIASRFEASDFREAAAGIFVPGNAAVQVYNPDGSVGFYNSFSDLRAEGINEEADDDAFKIFVPEGTEIYDSRSPKGGIPIVAHRGLVPAEFSEAIAIVEPSSGRSIWQALAIGTVMGVGLLGAILLFRRFRNQTG